MGAAGLPIPALSTGVAPEHMIPARAILTESDGHDNGRRRMARLRVPQMASRSEFSWSGDLVSSVRLPQWRWLLCKSRHFTSSRRSTFGARQCGPYAFHAVDGWRTGDSHARRPAVPTVARLTAESDALESEIEALRKAHLVLVRERGELEERVRDLTEALARACAEASQARAQADQANRMSEDLLSMVSHELRTPLQGMLSWSQILERVVLDPARARHATERIVANIESQTRMLDELLDLSRALSGKLVLNPDRIDLAQLIRNTVDAARSATAEKNVSIEVEVADAPLWIRADPVRIEQVLGTLANNALDAVDTDGRVLIECVADTTHVTVRVHDWGAGIDADELPHLFEPFRLARRSRKPHQGLGLGLPIARRIVELSAGEMSVRSEGLGYGATFTLRLPRADE